MTKKVYLIVAVDENFGIGKDKRMCWHLSSEMKFFKETTSKTENPDKINMVLMGRTTWESLPRKFRPLKGRMNVVLTRNPQYHADGGAVVNSYEEALELSEDKNIESIFVIGGAGVYKSVLDHPSITGIYLTKIKHEYECDTFFPEIPKNFNKKTKLRSEIEDGIKYHVYLLEKG
ncbi:dihydrofolate reductase [Candidatus Peregrinibacteria bacterium]|nr:dihydrofolate reductase [Candidatus Peregrinibacteria bacterium]